MKKTIVLYDSVRYFEPLIRQKGILVYLSLRKIPFILKIIRKVFLTLNLPLYIWLDKWKKEINEGDTIIIFASPRNKLALDYILKKNFNVRIIIWYWNPLSFYPDNLRLPDKRYEQWSFDETDCKKYALSYNTTFYFDNIKLPVCDISYDISFVGKDKGRKKKIEEFQKGIRKFNISTYFHIVSSDTADKKKELPYSDVLLIIAQSKAILDIIQDTQTGLTLRAMESLFFNKKLITNNQAMIHLDFYHPDNIFILGRDHLSSLSFFLNKPYFTISPDIKNKYDISNWLKRFKKNE